MEVLTPFYVDIPIPQAGVSGGGQQGFLSGQGSVGVQNVDIPASGRGGVGRVQQRCRFLRKTFLSGLWSRSLLVLIFLLVQVLVSFSRDMIQQQLVPSRSPSGGLHGYAEDRVLRRFLDLNTPMLLLGVHAELDDLLEVLKAPSQDRAQQPDVELVIAGFVVVSSSRRDLEVAASSSPVRRPSSAEQH